VRDEHRESSGGRASAAASRAASLAVAVSLVKQLLRRFFELNTKLSSRLEAHLGIPNESPLFNRFYEMVNDSVRALPDGATFVDVGAGRRCNYAAARDRNIRLVAVDISPEELAHNTDADETVVADVSKGLPFADGEVDLLVSFTLLEHVDGVDAAIRHIARVVRPCGRTIHMMPGRYALFAVAARLLPFGPLLRLLHFVIPESAGTVEFEVYYDDTEPVAIERLFTEAGFRNVTIEWTAAQASYFKALTPAYLLVALYASLVRTFGASRLAAYVIVSAER
jgi:2-polyprenyl-6-hydroxyphenyl methylase/3-demethylubiquinone-9 3-methyltransferase